MHSPCWFAFLAAASPSQGPLDGKTFVMKTGEKGKPASNEDTLVFRDGRFLSEACNPYGFGDAPYQAKDEGEAIRFPRRDAQPHPQDDGLGRSGPGRRPRGDQRLDPQALVLEHPAGVLVPGAAEGRKNANSRAGKTGRKEMNRG